MRRFGGDSIFILIFLPLQLRGLLIICFSRVAKSKTNRGFGDTTKGDNANRFQKIRNRNDYEAHRISRRLADFAHKRGATVIVFEALKNLQPSQEKYSRRSNQKRAYWLKSKIVQRTKYKAFQSYGIITSLVSPKNTSRHCALCNGHREENSLIMRLYSQYPHKKAATFQYIFRNKLKDNPSENPYYTPGAPNYICYQDINHKGNSDLNAARNIGLRFNARYYQKPRLKAETQGLRASHAASLAFGTEASRG